MLRTSILRAALAVLAFAAPAPTPLLAAPPTDSPTRSSARTDESVRKPTVAVAAPRGAATAGAAPGSAATAVFTVRNNSPSTRTFSFTAASSDRGVVAVGSAPGPRTLRAGQSVAVPVPYTVGPSAAGSRAQVTLTAADTEDGTLAHSASAQHATAVLLAAPEAWWNGGSTWTNPGQSGSATIRVTNNSNTARTLCFNAPPYGIVTPSIFSAGPTPPACRVFQAYETVNPMTVTYTLRPGAPAGVWDDIHAQVYDQGDPGLNNYAAPAWMHVYVNEYVGSPTVTPPAGQSGTPGSSHSATFSVQNNSNSTRSFSFAAASSNPGIATVGAAPGPQTLTAGQSATVSVPYTVGPSAAGSTAQVTLTATDAGDGTLAHSAAATHSTAVLLAAPEAWWNGGGSNWNDPGQAGSATIRVTNRSNTARTLCFNAPPHGRITPSIFSAGPTAPACQLVQAYETIPSLTVTYTVRPGAPAGVWDDIHAQVYDQGDPGLNNYAAPSWIHVYVNEYVGSPMVTVTAHPSGVPGGTATATFDVRNNSNSPRSFSFAVSSSDPAVAQMGAAPATQSIGAGQVASVSVTYNVLPSAQGTTAPITLRATDTQNAALTYSAAATHSTGILLAAPEATWNGEGSNWTNPGQAGSATIRVTNRSNAPRTLCFTAPPHGRVTPSIFSAGPAAPACRLFQPYETFNPATGPLAVAYTVRPDAPAGVWDDIQARAYDRDVPNLNNHDAAGWMHVYVNEALVRPTVTPGAASSGAPGTAQTASFTVRNNSNSRRTFTFSALHSDGAVVQVGAVPGPQALDPGQAVGVPVPYTVRPSAATSTAKIILGAADSQDGSLWHSAEVTHTTAVLLAAPDAWWNGGGSNWNDPGQAGSATIRVTNHSNTARTLCFNAPAYGRITPSIFSAGPTPPACRLFQAYETFNPASGPLAVTYTVRPGAPAGVWDDVQPQVHDQGDASLNNYAVAGWMHVYVNEHVASPALAAPAAQTDTRQAPRTVSFRLRNASNSRRSFSLVATSSDPAVVGDPADPPRISLAASDSTTVSVSYTPVKRGSATIRLLATDSADATRTGSGEFTSTVLNSAPTAELVFGPSDPVPGEAVRFDASASHDPDGDPLTYSWSFGDGRSYTGTETPISVAYAAPGSYRFVVSVSDGQGGTHADTVQVSVVADAQAPAITFAPASGTFTDPEVPVRVEWSDARGLDVSSLTLRLNGQEVPFWGTNWIGATWARSENTLHLVPGPNTLVASIRDRAGNVARDSVTYTFNAFVDVEVGASVGLTVNANTATAHPFQVTNTGTVGANFRLRAWCTGALSACGLQGDSLLYLPAGTTLSVPTAYTTGQSGTGLLWLKATAANDTTVTSEASLSVIITGGSGTPGAAAITPAQGGTLELPRNTSRPVSFSVANPGTAAGRYALSTTCAQGVLGCIVQPDTVEVYPGTPVTVQVQVTAAGAVGTTETATLTATLVGAGSATSAGQVVTITDPSSQAPLVALDSATAIPLIERDLCLTVAVGHEGASECGDLRLAHALPTVRTYNKARTPVLIYNSQHAEPNPLIALDVTAAAATEPLEEVRVTVTGGPANSQWSFTKSWPGAGFPAGQARRVVVADTVLSRLPTGIHAYQVTVAAVYGGTPHPALARAGELVVVNRRLDPAGTQANPLGAGWWLAGLERIYRVGSGLVWVGGDGSVRRYAQAPDGTWSGPALDGPDRIIPGPDSGFVRELKGGARVVFDVGGRHVATENRLGHRTVFDYQGEALSKITVPAPGQSPMTYVFDYGTLNQVRITAPGQSGGRTRETLFKLRGGRVNTIVDPDSTQVVFGLAGNTGRIGSRINRLQHRSEYRYDGAGKVVAGKIHMNPAADSIVVRIQPKESRGHAGPVAPDSVSTLIDGPRTDLADTTRFWLDRFGAPDSVQNALGQKTRLLRTNPSFPVLVTGVRLPNGFVTRAEYNGRGNLEVYREINPLGDGQDPETLYGYTNSLWPDFVTRVELPAGEVTSIEYDPAGNRAWQQPGERNIVSPRRASFHYHTNGAFRGMLHQVEGPSPTGSGTALETVTYDALRGNLETTTSAKAYTATLETDGLGRVTKTHAPIDVDPADTTRFLYRTDEVLEYDVMDRPLRTATRAPAINDVPPEMLHVSMAYDAEGLLRRLTRSTDGIDDPVSTVTTRWTYDHAGRTSRRISPDQTPADSTDNPYELNVYDPAGNTRTVRTRRTDQGGVAYSIEMEYDELNRLKVRRVPEVSYSRRDEGIPKYFGPSGGSCSSSVSALVRTYPSRPNSGCGYTIAAQADTFDYDVAGNLLVADNDDARIRRRYYPNGLLRGDTLYVRTAEGSDFSKHVYGLEIGYDRNGRRVELKHPDQLAPSPSQNLTLYGYRPATGELETVTDPLDNQFRYVYGTNGQLESLRLPGGIEETYGFDPDGNLRTHAVSGGVRAVTLHHDARGKVKSVVNAIGSRDQLSLRYSGMGNLAATEVFVYGEPGSTQPTFHGTEGMLYGALNNLSTAGSTQVTRAQGQTTTRNTGTTRSYEYEGTTDRLTRTLVSSVAPYNTGTRTTTRDDRFIYDGAGNLEFETQLYGSAGSCDSQSKSEADCADRASFYSADGLLRAAEQRTRAGSDGGDRWNVVFEEYRYDALGRRVWVRDRRECGGYIFTELKASCHSTVRRTVWDGQMELYEIQMPGEDGSAYLENDAGAIPIESYRSWWPSGGTPQPIPQDYFAYDPNPYFGRVGYTHGVGVDRPLSLIRVGYQRYYPAQMPNMGGQAASFSTFALIPVWDWRGQAEGTLFTDGARKRCEIIGGVERCIDGGVRQRWYSYDVGDVFFQEWHGTVLGGKRDGAGTLYRRARYYDPQTGRFTQEDPIGLAGGLNLYGYADGDPANLSDPSGNIPVPVITGLIGAGIGAAYGGYRYGWKGALIGGAVGGLTGAGAGGLAVRLGLLPAAVWASAGAPAGGKVGEVLMEGGSVTAAAQAVGKLKPPPIPSGMTQAEFGKLIGWGRGSAQARAQIGSLTREALEAAGVTRGMALEWARFYANEVVRNASNPSAAGRLDLMRHIADLLT